jgi:hypothetical protein
LIQEKVMLDLHLKVDFRRREVCIRERPGTRLRFNLGLPGGMKVTGENLMVTMRFDEEFDVSVDPRDRASNKTTVDGTPVYTVSDATMLVLAPRADGLPGMTVRGVGALGTAQVNVTADADLGEGTQEIADFIDVELHAGKATTLGATAEPLRDQALNVTTSPVRKQTAFKGKAPVVPPTTKPSPTARAYGS